MGRLSLSSMPDIFFVFLQGASPLFPCISCCSRFNSQSPVSLASSLTFKLLRNDPLACEPGGQVHDKPILGVMMIFGRDGCTCREGWQLPMLLSVPLTTEPSHNGFESFDYVLSQGRKVLWYAIVGGRKENHQVPTHTDSSSCLDTCYRQQPAAQLTAMLYRLISNSMHDLV